MKILLTGASGFLGKNFLLEKASDWTVYALYHATTDFPAFIERYQLDRVEPLRCDLTSVESARALLLRVPEKLDAIVHLAANGDPAYSVEDPRTDLLAGAVSLVTLLTVFACDRLVYLSSGAVYDGLKGLVGPETPASPMLPYAISKLATEQYVKFFRKSSRVGGYVILRFFGAYGPHEPERKIFTRLVRWAMAPGDKPFEVRGDGKNLIDAMYVGDVVQGIRQVLCSAVVDEVVDFGSGSPISVNELVETAARVLGKRAPRIRYVGAVPEYIQFFVSPEKMERLFGFRPQIPLEQGLMRLRRHLVQTETAT